MLIIGNWITRVLVIVMCVAIFISLVFLRKPPAKSQSASWVEWLRLAHFAEANGWGMNINASNLPSPRPQTYLTTSPNTRVFSLPLLYGLTAN